MIGETLKYFALVSGALFLPYLAYKKCKSDAITTGAGTFNNYMSLAAPPSAAATEDIRQEIHVGGGPLEQGKAVLHKEGCRNSRVRPSTRHSHETEGSTQGDQTEDKEGLKLISYVTF